MLEWKSVDASSKLPLTCGGNVKGYLRYKTLTTQNVSSEAHIKNFFIL